MAAIVGLCGQRWYIAGNFNVARFGREKLNSNRVTRSMNELDSLIRDLELRDPPLLNGLFTWSNFRETPVCSRLDRFMFSQQWEEILPNYRQLLGPRITSDHFPVLFDTGPTKWGRMPFRFENIWLSHPSFRNCMRD